MKRVIGWAFLEAVVIEVGVILLSYLLGNITGYPPFAVSLPEQAVSFVVLFVICLVERIWRERKKDKQKKE